jgi:hypothetical protein
MVGLGYGRIVSTKSSFFARMRRQVVAEAAAA